MFVGAGDGPCAILVIGVRPDEPLHYPVSEVAAGCGASVATATGNADEVYTYWPGDYERQRLPWPPESATTS